MRFDRGTLWSIALLLLSQVVSQPTALGQAVRRLVDGSSPSNILKASETAVTLDIQDAIDLALSNDPKARIAWADAKAQAMRVRAEKSSYWPSLQFTGADRWVTTKTEVERLPFFGSDNESLTPSGRLRLDWLLYDFGGRGARVKAAAELLVAASATQNQVVRETFRDAALAFLAAEHAKNNLAALQQNETDASDSFKVAEAKHAGGTTAMIDVLHAKTALLRAAALRIEGEREVAVRVAELASMLGMYPGAKLDLVSWKVSEQASLDEAIAVVERALKAHPRLLAARAEIDAATLDIKKIQAQRWPTISLQSDWFYSHQRYISSNSRFTPGEIPNDHIARSSYVALQVTVPLFSGFGQSARIQEARAKLEARQQVFDLEEREISLQVWTYYYDVKSYSEALVLANELLSIADSSLVVAKARYSEGVGDIVEVLSAQAAKADAHLQYQRAAFEAGKARVLLASVLGELNPASM